MSYGWFCLCAALLATFANLARGLRPGDRGVGAFLTIWIAGGLGGFLTNRETSYIVVKIGVPQVWVYALGCIFADIAAFCVTATLIHTIRDRATKQINRRHAFMLTLCVVSIISILVLADVHLRPNVDVLDAYGRMPAIAAIQIIYPLFIGVCAAESIRAFIRYSYGSKEAQRPRRVMISMFLINVGAAFAVIWAICLMVRAVTDVCGIRVLDRTALTETLSACCFSSMVIGVTWLVGAPFAVKSLLRLWAWYAEWRLSPLHHEIRDVAEDLILNVEHEDIDLRSVGISTEIQDIAEALVEHVHPKVEQWAQKEATSCRLSGRKVSAFIAAAKLMSAVDAYGERLQDNVATKPVSSDSIHAEETVRRDHHDTPAPRQKFKELARISPSNVDLDESMRDVVRTPSSLIAQIREDLPLIQIAAMFRRPEINALVARTRQDREATANSRAA